MGRRKEREGVGWNEIERGKREERNAVEQMRRRGMVKGRRKWTEERCKIRETSKKNNNLNNEKKDKERTIRIK